MADKQAKAKQPANKAAKPADKPAKPKKEKKEAEAAVAEAPAKPVVERKPADPRLKYMKRMKGRFLPKGSLRDRHKAILDRWNSGEDHGGVTLDELKSLYADWKTARAKPGQPVA